MKAVQFCGSISDCAVVVLKAANTEGNVDLEAKLAELRVYCPDETKQDKPVYNSAGDSLDIKDAAEKMMKGEVSMSKIVYLLGEGVIYVLYKLNLFDILGVTGIGAVVL